MRSSIWILAALLPVAGCDQLTVVETDDTAGGGIPGPVQERLTEYCATPVCHSGAVGPDLSPGAADAILSVSSGSGVPFVVIGDVAGSYLATKMLPGPAIGTVMPPPSSPPMPAEDLALVLGWIAGAEFPDDGPGMTGGSTGGSSSSGPDTSPPGTTTSDSGGSDETGDAGGDPQVCSLEAVQSGAASPVDAGDGAGQIPTAVGEALIRNCGCHYATEATPPNSPLLGTAYQPMETLAHFVDGYVGINAATYGSGSGADSVLDRVVTQKNMPALVTCDLGGGELITPDDFDLLRTWLEAGTPDGATF